MLVCVSSHNFAHETAGAARTRHSLLPLRGRMSVQTSGKPCREKAKLCLEKLCLEMAPQAPHTRCHHPRMRVIQYAAASRLERCYLSNTGSPGPGYARASPRLPLAGAPKL